MNKIVALAAAIGLHLLFQPGLASAQTYPSRPIRIIVPFEASGAMDVVMRIVAKKVTDNGAAQIVIENKTGAGGAIGVMAVKEAAPDGYLLGEVSSSTHVLNPHTTANIPYDPVKDFVPVALLVRVPTLLAVPAGSPAKSLAELIAAGADQARRPELRFGRCRLRTAYHWRAAGEIERRADDPHSVSRTGRRDERPARRPPRLCLQQHPIARRRRGRRQGQALGRGRRQAHRSPSEHTRRWRNSAGRRSTSTCGSVSSRLSAPIRRLCASSTRCSSRRPTIRN